MTFDFEQQVERATNDWLQQQVNQERHQRVAELYGKMVSSKLFSDDELSLAKMEFAL